MSLHSRVTESHDIDSHISGMLQAGSRDQVILWQLNTMPFRVKFSKQTNQLQRQITASV